jgi:putative aminopeptidase FrvX
MKELDLLTKLVETPGLPGREEKITKLILENIPSNWETKIDPIGNLISHLPGNGKRVLLTAHMDEVGLIVRRITKEGFLLIDRLGGINIYTLPGSRLDLWTDRGKLPAQGGILPQHLADNKIIDLTRLYLDVGAVSQAEVNKMGIKVGDGLTWNAPLRIFGKDIISGKALDDRLGCWTLINLIQSIGEPLPCDLFLAFIVQEETSLASSTPVAQSINPDIIIGIDGTLVFDTPDLESQQSDVRLGCGPALKWMDSIHGKSGTYIPSFPLVKRIRELASASNIPLQTEIISGLTTTVNLLPFANQGIKTAAISLPIRYHHSPIETASLKDADEVLKLVSLIIQDQELVGF